MGRISLKLKKSIQLGNIFWSQISNTIKSIHRGTKELRIKMKKKKFELRFTVKIFVVFMQKQKIICKAFKSEAN